MAGLFSIRHLIDKVASIFDATAEMQREALREDNLSTALDCVADQGRDAGAVAAQADWAAGFIDPHPSPPIGNTWEACGVAEVADTPDPLPPLPTTRLQAFVVVAGYPTELDTPDAEFQAGNKFVESYLQGYRAQMDREFTTRLEALLSAGAQQAAEPVSVCDQWVTPSGHVIPPLDIYAPVPPQEVLATCVYERNPPPWAESSPSGGDSGTSGAGDGGSGGGDSSSGASDE